MISFNWQNFVVSSITKPNRIIGVRFGLIAECLFRKSLKSYNLKYRPADVSLFFTAKFDWSEAFQLTTPKPNEFTQQRKVWRQVRKHTWSDLGILDSRDFISSYLGLFFIRFIPSRTSPAWQLNFNLVQVCKDLPEYFVIGGMFFVLYFKLCNCNSLCIFLAKLIVN